jgi:tyrosyl-tRNA synthetase
MEVPREMFGKLMSIPDESISIYFRLTTERSDRDIQEIEARLKRGENPRDIKLELAREVTAIYHGGETAERARMEFIRVFSNKEAPQDLETVTLPAGSYEAAAVILTLKLTKSRSEAFRLVTQGALEITPPDAAKFRPGDPRELIRLSSGTVIRLGKTRFIKIA